jgi:hypothetical protein
MPCGETCASETVAQQLMCQDGAYYASIFAGMHEAKMHEAENRQVWQA